MPPLYRTPGVHIEKAEDRFYPIDRVPTGVPVILGCAPSGPVNDPQRIATYEAYERIFGGGQDMLSLAVRGFFDNGGETAYILNVNPDFRDPAPDDYIGARGTEPRGIRMVERLEEPDLLIAPDLMSHYGRTDGFADPDSIVAVQNAMIAHCEGRRDMFTILDPLPGMSLDEAIEHRNRFDTSFASYYYPWLKTRVGTEAGPPIPPSAFVAGVYARTDLNEGVHRAPANLKLEGVVDVESLIRKRDRDHLVEHRVNGIIPFYARGIRVWGGRTLTSDPAFRHINVRRLFILIRKSLERHTQWVVFEPNGEILWKQLARTVTSFLLELWEDGALLGEKPEEAFYVKCDEETNPPESRDQGILTVEIGIAPTKPAEFIVVRLHQWTRERSGEAAGQEAAPAEG
jgi:hypothetical protein